MPHSAPQPDSSSPSAAEVERVAALARSGLLEAPLPAELGTLAELAATLCSAAVGFFAFVDHDRVWYKAGEGLAGTSRARQDDPVGWVIDDDVVVVVDDLANDTRSAQVARPEGAAHEGSFAGVGVGAVEGCRIGVLGVFDPRSRSLDGSAREALAGLARLAAAVIQRESLRRELEMAREQARRLASVDTLTGLLNRRTVLERLDVEVERAHRFHAPLAVVMLDIDGFRAFNDRHGHELGDAVLREIGGIIRDELRQVDLAGRSGGEEFCIILPGTPLPGAMTLADALRQEIGRHEHGDGVSAVTASLGVAMLDGDDPVDAMTLLKRASDAMAHAWQEGGDRVQHGSGPIAGA